MRPYLILLFTVLLLAGCVSPQPLLKNPTPIPTLIPATMPAVEAEVKAEGGDGLGQQVFQANCSACHNLSAETKVGPGLAGLFERAELPNGSPVNDETIKEWIKTGGGDMPSLSLFEDELKALIAYLDNATR